MDLDLGVAVDDDDDDDDDDEVMTGWTISRDVWMMGGSYGMYINKGRSYAHVT